MARRKVLITGGAGFIGSHLAERLASDGEVVVVLDNFKWSTREPNCSRIIRGDVLDRELVDDLVSAADEVIHTAAQINVDYANQHPQETIDINIQGTMNLLAACRKHGKPMIFASSSEVYGSAQSPAIAEDHALDAQGVYAATKVAGDRLCKAYVDAYGMDVRILRSFNTFGPHQRRDSYGGVIAIFTDRALRGLPPIIFGDGEQERDYLWIEDAIQGYVVMRRAGRPGEPVNFGTGKSVSVNYIAQAIRELVGGPEAQHADNRAGEVRRLRADISRAKRLGFSPSMSFEKGLEKYVSWCKTQMERQPIR